MAKTAASGLRSRAPELVVRENKCIGCRICEIICSYHHKKIFSRKTSSIHVRRIERKGEFKIIIYSKETDKRAACDLCKGEKMPLCVKFCPREAIKIKEG